MTEERKQYLASISKEERVIRYQLKIHNACIRNCKYDLNFNKHCIIPYSVLTETIRDEKTIIKALKKQLPAPREYWYNNGNSYIGCSVCRFNTQPYYTYCCKCGQKLR